MINNAKTPAKTASATPITINNGDRPNSIPKIQDWFRSWVANHQGISPHQAWADPPTALLLSSFAYEETLT